MSPGSALFNTLPPAPRRDRRVSPPDSLTWFADTLGGVLNEQHQFPIGSRYDAESLAAAHAVLSGRRTLDADALYYQSLNATQRRPDAPLATVGSFAFYNS